MDRTHQIRSAVLKSKLAKLVVGAQFPAAEYFGIDWMRGEPWTVTAVARTSSTMPLEGGAAPASAVVAVVRVEDGNPWLACAVFADDVGLLPDAEGALLPAIPLHAGGGPEDLALSARFVDALRPDAQALWVSLTEGAEYLLAMEYIFTRHGGSLHAALSVCGADPAGYADKTPEVNRARAAEVRRSYRPGFVAPPHPREFAIEQTYRGRPLVMRFTWDARAARYVAR